MPMPIHVAHFPRGVKGGMADRFEKTASRLSGVEIARTAQIDPKLGYYTVELRVPSGNLGIIAKLLNLTAWYKGYLIGPGIKVIERELLKDGLEDVVLVFIDDGYLAAAELSEQVGGNYESYFPDLSDEEDVQFVEAILPVSLAEKVIAQGTSDQVFGDGYEAADAVAAWVPELGDPEAGAAFGGVGMMARQKQRSAKNSIVLLDTKEDMDWLKETHLANVADEPNVKRAKSAVLEGNEDWPDKIMIFDHKSPRYDEEPSAVFVLDEEGEAVRQ